MKPLFAHLESLKPLFACRHLNTPLVEGKTHCPDCGSGVVFHWQVLRCEHCRQRRSARYFLRRLIPHKPFCTHCGSSDYTIEWLTKPAYYQLDKALLVASSEHDYLEDFRRWRDRLSTLSSLSLWARRKAQGFTQAWLDPSPLPRTAHRTSQIRVPLLLVAT